MKQNQLTLDIGNFKFDRNQYAKEYAAKLNEYDSKFRQYQNGIRSKGGGIQQSEDDLSAVEELAQHPEVAVQNEESPDIESYGEEEKTSAETLDSSEPEVVQYNSTIALAATTDGGLSNVPAVKDFVDYLTKAVFEGVNTNVVFRREPAGINPIRMALADSHYDHNRGLTFDGYITDQLSGNAAEAKMGFDNFGSNACGWIAVYNALVSIDKKKQPADIIRYIENHDGLILDGLLGVSPIIYDELFKHYGIEAKTTFRKGNLDETEKEGKTAILTYVYFSQKDHAPSVLDIGAHNISFTWDESLGKYYAYNPGVEEYVSIEDFLNTKVTTRSFISLTVIY